MAKLSKKQVTVAILVVCIGLVAGIKFFVEFSRGGVPTGNKVRIRGDLQSPIRITEFIDFECPACAQGFQMLKTFMREHPKTIRVELKYFPLSMHPHGVLAARYAECAGRQDKFWPFADLLIERQSNWKRLVDAVPAFEVIAKDAGMNLHELKACLDEPGVIAAIQKDKEEGGILGVKSTPTYFVNGEMVVGVNSLETELNKRLKDGSR